MNLKDFFEKTIKECIEEFNDFTIKEWSDIFYEYKNNFIDFPRIEDQHYVNNVDEDIEEDFGTMEEIDFENFFITSIDLDSNEFSIVAFGDWQDPYEINIIFDEGDFYFESPIKNENYNILDENEVLETILGEKWEEEINNIK